MVVLDYQVGRRLIAISGEDLSQLMKNPRAAVHFAALGFTTESNGGCSLEGVTDPGRALTDVIRMLKTLGQPFSLTEVAKGILRGRLEYLRSYNAARNAGLDLDEEGIADIDLPGEFIRPLKPVQIGPVKRLITVPHSANFSVPGSGKTTMVLAAFASMKEMGIVSRMLVVCPRSAFTPWEEEFEACFGRRPRSYRISGFPEGRRRELEKGAEYELILTTYQMFANEVDSISALMAVNDYLMIIDESHHLKKGQGGVWFDAVSAAGLLARRRMILTGTPAPNSLKDLESQFELLWPGLGLATPPNGETAEIQLESVRESIRPFYARIRKSDLGLPERVCETYWVTMKPVQRRIYEVLTAAVLDSLVGSESHRQFVRELKRSQIVRLIEAASNPSLLAEYSQEFNVPPLPYAGVEIDQLIRQYSRFETPAKFDRAVDLAERIVRRGRKVTIWTFFRDNAFSISKMLRIKGLGSVCITGTGTDDPDVEGRDEAIGKFKADSNTTILVATVQSIGESISLHTACTDAIYVDRSFNCGQFIQSLDRIHRIGLPPEATVAYHLLLSPDSIDTVIDRRLTEKMERMMRLLNDDVGILNLDSDDADEDVDTLDYEAVMSFIGHRRPLAR